MITMTRTKPLLSMTAADLMSRDVITVPRKMSLRAAAHMLVQSHISGAPVVDDRGRCVGVLSTTDLVHWLDRGEWSAKRHDDTEECGCTDWQTGDPQPIVCDDVNRYMTIDLVTVAPEASIGDLARQMLDAHIHRIIVVDAANRPVGVVSSIDILAAVARSER